MAKGAKTQTQTTNSTGSSTSTINPWAPAAGAFTDLVSAAGNAYSATPKTAFFGDLFARPNSTQKAAQASAMGVASTAGMGANELRQLGLDSIAGKFLDPTQNAPLQAAIQGGINPLREQLSKNVLSIGDASQMMGAYGGSRQGVVEGTALRGYNSDAMNLAAGMNYDAYQRERERQLSAGDLLTQATAIGLQPSQILDRVGTQQQEWDQAILDEALARHNMELEAPWAGLDKYAQILGTVTPFASQSGTTEQKGTSTVPLAKGNAAQGALGGAAAGSTFGPWGAAIGGVLGGLGSLFG